MKSMPARKKIILLVMAMADIIAFDLIPRDLSWGFFNKKNSVVLAEFAFIYLG